MGDKILKELLELNSFGKEINNFLKHINAQLNIVPFVMQLIQLKNIKEKSNIDAFIKKNDIRNKINKNNGESILYVPIDKITEFDKLEESLTTALIANKLLPVNFIVSFVSQFDAFLGSVIRQMFKVKPEMLNDTDKNLQYSQLIKYKTIEEAKLELIEKEVDAILRESHIKHFKWLEDKLKIPMTKDLDSFSDFIEITERRNLFVHCDGIVSSQYLNICKQNNVSNIDKIEIGTRLFVNAKYIVHCYNVLFEIGVKLGNVIWRKLIPKDNYIADVHLNEICYNLIITKKYKLALKLLDFATDILKHKKKQDIYFTLLINKALTHYLKGGHKACNEILDSQDWSALDEVFKLAYYVLKEDYKIASDIMQSIGSNNDRLNKDAYKEWPLFEKWRPQKTFKTLYKNIFNEELIFYKKNQDEISDLLKLHTQKRKERNIKNKQTSKN